MQHYWLKRHRKWLKESEEKIAVFYLPSYSPELNPDELLNADLRHRVTKAAPARTKIALTRTAVGALHSIQKQPNRVERYFEHDGVCYAALHCLGAGSIKKRCTPASKSARTLWRRVGRGSKLCPQRTRKSWS